MLRARLAGLAPAERREIVESVRGRFRASGGSAAAPGAGTGPGLERAGRQLARLFGREAVPGELGSPEFVERLAAALNAVFESLNGIMATIDATLLGKSAETETIRHMIGSSLDAGSGTQSIEDRLARIREAFLVAHRAFQEAARAKVGQLLAEMDPERLEAQAEGGLKFGPLRKAELFDAYKEKFAACRAWHSSGRFTEDLLREFEKNCRKLYSTGRKGGS